MVQKMKIQLNPAIYYETGESHLIINIRPSRPVNY